MTTTLTRRIEEWGLALIDDNPFNPRLFYKPQKVADKAESIKQNGLLQVPKARVKEGRAQLAFGGYRKRAFLKLHKEDPKKWKSMPLEIEDLTDNQMIIFAIEENLKRDDNTPIEVARAIEVYFQHFPESTEIALGKKMNMTQGNISNMRRVLTLPENVLEKIDEGRISFTMGRELLILKDLNADTYHEWSSKEGKNIEHEKDEAWLMKEAIRHIRGPDSADRYGVQENPTVEGMQKAIHTVVHTNFKQLDTDIPGSSYSYSYNSPLFNTREAGCLKCEKMILTHPTKSGCAHYCTDEACWEKHQKDHQTKMATEAVAKRQADLQRIAAEQAAQIEAERQAVISQEIAPSYNLKKHGPSWIAQDEKGDIIAIGDDKTEADTKAALYFEPIETVLDPQRGFILNHTYRIIPKTGRRLENFISDVTAQDVATAIEAVGLGADDCEEVKVWKSSGKPGTSGQISAGWSKCREYIDAHLEEEKPVKPEPSTKREFEDKQLRANRLRYLPDGYPCKTCVKCMTCSGADCYAEDERMVCDNQITRDQVAQKVESAKAAVPEELTAAMVQAGTRGQVVDLHGLWADSYQHETITGYIRIDNLLEEMENPVECTEKCTRGFHYAFDSSDREPRTYQICDDKKCVAKKKAAFTRAKNAKNNAKKNAERAAFKIAVEATSGLDLPRMKVILYAQLHGQHCDQYSYSTNTALSWLCHKLKIEEEQGEGKEKALWKVVNKMEAQELARLLVELMLNMLTHQTSVSSNFYGSNRDFQDYKIKTTEVLNWMGVAVQLEKGGEL